MTNACFSVVEGHVPGLPPKSTHIYVNSSRTRKVGFTRYLLHPL